jgi:hypothetical protein
MGDKIQMEVRLTLMENRIMRIMIWAMDIIVEDLKANGKNPILSKINRLFR